MDWLAALIMFVLSIAGVAMAVVTLPGMWFMLLAALVMQWLRPGTFSWWTLGAGLAIAALGEIIDVVASAFGAGAAGGTRPGALGSIAGGLVGAIVGLFVPPQPLSTIGLSALGAALGAFAGEHVISRQGFDRSVRVATAAAAGRLIATLAKIALAILLAITLTIAALVP